jgi:glyoxylase-like metal-dependent hydrolase (beta-lactamase superfamily II)
MGIERFPYNISCIDTGYLQRQGLAAAYLIESGGEAAFIDTGTTHALPLLLEALAQQGLSRSQVKYVIPTHVHLDHAGGSGALMQQLPEAQLVCHPAGARHLIDPEKLIAGATAVYGDSRFQEMFGELTPVPAERVMEAPDGFSLLLGERELLCLDTPGHARHHLCVFDLESQGIFSGDTFGLSYRELDTQRGHFIIPTSTPVQFDPEAWHETLNSLMSLNPQSFYLTHYGRVGEPARLAAALHRSIDDFAGVAIAAQDADDRIAKIRERLSVWLEAQLEAHGCALSRQRIEEILGMDLDLNAQGLEVWLSRQERA